MENLKQVLFQLHLNDKQATILLGLIKLGRATVSAIARESGVTRTHVYGLIKELADQGLVSEIEEAGIKTFEAVDFVGLQAFISRQQKELQTVSKKLEHLATEFNALQVGPQQKTKVRFFDGVEGIKSIYAEVERDCTGNKKPTELLTIFSPVVLEKVLPNFIYFNFQNVVARDIVCEDEFLANYKKQIQAVPAIQYKVWPKARGLFPSDTVIWGNKIAYTDLSGYPSGIIIENDSIAETARMFFDGLWGTL